MFKSKLRKVMFFSLGILPGLVAGLTVLPPAHRLIAQMRTPVPNIPLNDAAGQFWSLKTVDDGSGNQEIVISCAAGCTTAPGAGSTAINDGSTTSQKAAVDAAGNLSTNLGKVSGTALSVGTGAVGTGTPRVAVGTDTATVAGSAPGTTGSGCGTAAPSATLFKAFSNAASASNLLLVSGVSNQKIHICGINIGPTGGAVNVALVEGTTVTNACDTSTAGVAGGATSGTGWNFAANGGLTMGNGQGVIAATATNADHLCLLFGGAVQVSGVITYAQY